LRLLLDTHIALWALVASPRLSVRAGSLISDKQNLIAVSAASIWEIAIKYARNRGIEGDMPISGGEACRLFEGAGFLLLPVAPAHAAAVDELPRTHGDPFDRLLIAQARFESMTLLTHDRKVAAYSDSILLV